jgi:hypothetical protein
MGTSDDSFRAEGPGLFGFLTDSDDDNVPVKAFGTVGYAPNVGVLGFSGVAADPEGPIQQNSYSQRAGVEGGSVDFTGTAGVSLNHVGVYGQVEDSPPVPAGFRAGVLGAASTQPGVIGFSRDGDGIEGASFTSTARSSAPALRAFRARSLASAAFPAHRDRRSSTLRTSPASAARRMRSMA